ncbi:MAG: carboxypeptidase-like regulatory domain-containing protein [Bacteroidales bacterium]|nr:carboxypeptidase-like regulatory domain-containing protein [Bacteroidales bacterium]
MGNKTGIGSQTKTWVAKAATLVMSVASLIFPTPSYSAALPTSENENANAPTASPTVKIEGTVTDAQTAEPLPFANVVLWHTAQPTPTLVAQTAADANGNFSLSTPPIGNLSIEARYIGYAPTLLSIAAPASVELKLVKTDQSLAEVTVRAKEKADAQTSTTIIDATAMSHLQPSSLTDLMSLLPGAIGTEPNMSKVNKMEMREVGTTDDNYATSALGTRIAVDGHTMGTDANMQHIASSTPGDEDSKRNNTLSGVDLRTVSADDIESIEVIRGIPSVTHGDLTSGVVNITRRLGHSPLTIMLKADQHSKLLFASKGISTPKGWDLTASADLLNSRADARNPYETFTRLGLSVRTRHTWASTRGATLTFKSAADAQRTIDNMETDPEQQTDPDDKYKNAHTRTALQGELLWARGSNMLSIKQQLSLQTDRIEQRKRMRQGSDNYVSSTSPTPSDTAGLVARATALPYDYVAHHTVEGKPFYANTQVAWTQRIETGHVPTLANAPTLTNTIGAGAEWQCNKNFGRGQLFDPTRPLLLTNTHRPRSYKDLKATNIVSLYAEDALSTKLGQWGLTLNVGVRLTHMLGLGKAHTMRGKVYADPRATLRIDLPTWGRTHLTLTAGAGRMSKMPTMEMLNPDVIYTDLSELKYWNADSLKRWSLIRSFATDRTNYNLEPARNVKTELRLSGRVTPRNGMSSHTFSVTLFHEQMDDAFRQQSTPKVFNYNKYDASLVEGKNMLPTPQSAAVIKNITTTTNGSGIEKTGVEWEYTSPRWRTLCTRLTLSGAWFKSQYRNSTDEWWAGTNATILGVVIDNNYVGLYPWRQGQTRERVTTTATTETYIDQMGLILSVSADILFMSRTRIPLKSGAPVAYMTTDGIIRPYDDAAATDTYAQALTLKESEAVETDERPYATFNIKATKQMGTYLTLSFFADRLLYAARDYEKDGQLIRRTFDPYFGLTLTVKI